MRRGVPPPSSRNLAASQHALWMPPSAYEVKGGVSDDVNLFVLLALQLRADLGERLELQLHPGGEYFGNLRQR